MPALIHGPYEDGKCVGITGASKALGKWKVATLCSIAELLPAGRAIYYLDLDFFNTEFKFVFLPVLPTQSAPDKVRIDKQTVIWEDGNNSHFQRNDTCEFGYHFGEFRTVEKRNLLKQLASITDYI